MLSRDNDALVLELSGKYSREQLEALFAIKAAVGNPDVVNNVMAFEKICLALSGEIPSFEHVECPTAFQVINAIVQLRKRDVQPTSESVLKYIACVLYDDGFVIAPKSVSFVQKYLDQLVSDHARELFAALTADALLEYRGDEEFEPISVQAEKHRAAKALFGE